MRPLVCCHGTWGRADPWHRPGSPLRQWLEKDLGFVIYDFLWSGALGGVDSLPPLKPPADPSTPFWEGGTTWPWLEAGEKLALQLYAWGLHAPDVVSHSHGAQVVYACAALTETRFGLHVSISGPVRKDMQRIRRKAMGFIATRVQVYDPVDDHVIREGEAFDGHVGWVYELPEPGAINIASPGTGHSGLVHDPSRWEALGLRDLLLTGQWVPPVDPHGAVLREAPPG